MKKSKSYRELQFENEHVRVWKTVVSPDQPLENQSHSSERVVIGLKGGTLKQVDAKGEITQQHFDTHKAYWLNGNLKSEDRNQGSEPVEVMVVEMKKPKDRPLPSIPID